MMRIRLPHQRRFRHWGSTVWPRARAALLTTIVLVAIPGSSYAASWEQLRYPGEIKCLVPAGRYVWIGGDNGAWRFDTKTNYILPFEEEINIRGESIALAGRIVKDIAVDARGRVWFACWHKIKVGGGAGISVFDGVGWLSFTEEDGLAGNDVLSISIDTADRVWIGTTKGLSLYYEGLWTTYTTADGLMRDDPVELYTDHLGRMWCGFWRGVNVFYRDQWWTWERQGVNYVYGIVQDDENKVYCSTKGGFAVYDGERWSRVLNRGDLRKRLMSSVVTDDSGNIWCSWGREAKGVSVFDGERWARVTKRNTKGGLASDRIVQIGKDHLGRLWFGARDGQVSVMIPDGGPGIGREDMKTSSLWYPGDKFAYGSATNSQSLFSTGGFLSRIIDRKRGLEGSRSLPFLRLPSLLAVSGVNFIEWRGKSLSETNKFPIPDLEWEEPIREPSWAEPVLIAQAPARNPAPSEMPATLTTQIQIDNPPGLMTATEQAPFAIDKIILDVQGSVGTTEKIDKVEVNGFQVALQSGISMGNLNFYNFAGSVMVPGITVVRFELFKGERSVFAREFPVTVPAKESEDIPPDIYFIDPNVPEDEIIAARSGETEKIRIQLSVRRRGEVKGIATDDTGVKEVRVNGQIAFMTDAAPSRLREHNITKVGGAKYFEQAFDLETGPNAITIEAIDLFGNIAPLSLDLFVQELLSDATFYKSSWAFIVGIDKYKHWGPLGNAVNDAKGMRELLETKLNFPPEHIFDIYNEEATKENIFNEFDEVSAAGESDRVVIFLACHGHTQPSRKGEQGYLIPTDGVFIPGKHPTLKQRNTWISMNDLSDQLGLLQAKHILLVVDACYSGLMTARRGAGPDLRGERILQDQVTARYLELAEELAIEVITAGSKDETVFDGGYKDHSVFTGYLIRGLETGEADQTRDGVITSEELGTYVSHKVQQFTGNKQHPRYCKLPGYEDEKGTVLFVVPQGTMQTTMSDEPGQEAGAIFLTSRRSAQ